MPSHPRLRRSGAWVPLVTALTLHARPGLASDAPAVANSFLMVGGGYATGGYDAGVSARAGTTAANGVSLGFSLTFQAARLTAVGDTTPPVYTHFSAPLGYAGPEFGYDARVGRFVLRPYFGLGFGLLDPERAQPATPSGGLAAWLGLQATVDIPRTPLFVGVDLRAQLLYAPPYNQGSTGGFALIGVWLGSAE